MKKKIVVLLLTVIMVSMFSVANYAATTAKVTRIYGTETTAFGASTFKEFYASQMFVWVQLDTDVSTPAGFSPMLNRQALGDSVLKPAANDKIKIGGMTIKQLNAASGNPYSAMVAYEDNGSGKIRMSIWLSWGGSSIQDLFKKEVHPEITLEILSGMKIPGPGYSAANKVYADLTPIKYKLSIVDLEFKSDTTAQGYDATKKDWVRPMFEELTAQWTLAGSNATPTPTKPASSTVSSKSNSVSTPATSSQTTSNSVVTSTDITSNSESATASLETSLENSQVSEISSEAISNDPAASSSNDSKPADENNAPIPLLPIIFGVVGIAIIASGIGYFIFLKRKG